MELENTIAAHYLNLNFSNNFLGKTDSQLYVELPYPINKPLKDTNIDIINKFHDDVENYTNQLTTITKEFKSVKEKIMAQEFTNTHATITKGILHLCNCEKAEPPFSCDYNPYYINGSLKHFYLEGKDYLVRPDCDNNLRITNIEKPWKNHKLHFERDFGENITGISTYNRKKCLMLTQHSNEVNLVKITDLDQILEVKWSKNFKEKISDSKIYKKKVGVSFLNSHFKLYDIESNQKIGLKAYDIDTVFCSEFLSDHELLLLGPQKLKIIDLRSNDHQNFQPDVKNHCNHLCSAKVVNDHIYVATKHHLIRSDARFSKNVEFCTHLMKSSPCYMDFTDNYLCLSSQKFEERVLFSGLPIDSLPINVPNIFETLNKCKLQKDILLREEIGKRIQKSVAGIKLLSRGKDVYLYTSNSVGDIFVQKIANNIDEDSSLKAVESLFHWSKKLPSTPKPLHLTGAVNLSDARFALHKRTQTEHLQKFTKKSNKTNHFLNHFGQFYNKNNLGELATNFVSIWDDDEEEPIEDVDIVPEVAPIDKVSKWIESSFFD